MTGQKIPSQEGKLYPAGVIDLLSRSPLRFAVGECCDAELAAGSFKMATAISGGDLRVWCSFHS